MQGSITWLPATEENIKQIPLALKVEGEHFDHRKLTIECLFKHTHWGLFVGSFSYHYGDAIVHRGGVIPMKEFTHFAYLNEPE